MDMYVDLEVDVDINVNTDSEIWFLENFAINHSNRYAIHSYESYIIVFFC